VILYGGILKVVYRSGICILLAIGLAVFQNCSGPAFSSIKTLTDGLLLQTSTEASGNGNSYDGKLLSSYFRFIPGYTCEGKESFKELVEIHNGKFFIYENQLNFCSSEARELNANEVELSPFQNEFISVNDFLYAKYEYSPTRIPDLLPETLCRDNFNSPKIEIVTHYNRASKSATTKVYSYDSGGTVTKTEDLETSRLFGGQSIEYASFSGEFKFSVNLEMSLKDYPRRFVGEITKVGSGLQFSSEVKESSMLTCITGGGLDTQIWPLKSVIDRYIDGFQVHPTNQEIFFWGSVLGEINYNFKHLYRLKKEGGFQDISRDIFGDVMHLSKSLIIPDSNWMAFSGNPATNGWDHFLYLYDPRLPAGPLKVMVNRGQERSETIRPPSSYMPFEVNQWGPDDVGFWVDRTTIIESQTRYAGQFFRIYNPSTDSVQDFLQSPASSARVVSRKSGIVASFVKDRLAVLNYADLKTKFFDLPVASQCLPNIGPLLSSSQKLVLAEQSHFAVIEYACGGGLKKIFSISLQDGSFRLLAEGQTILWNSKDGEQILTGRWVPTDAAASEVDYSVGGYDPSRSYLINVADGKVVPTRLDPHLDFSIDQNQLSDARNYSWSNFRYPSLVQIGGHWLAGLSTGEGDELILTDLSSLTEKTVCKNATGTKIRVDLLSEDRAALLAVNQSKGEIAIYEVSDSDHCRVINAFPSDRLIIKAYAGTRLGIGLSLGKSIDYVAGKDRVESDDRAVFVPANGRSPLLLNPEGRYFDRLIQMEASPDQTRIYLMGYFFKETFLKRQLFSFELSP
jgi:hypothetical protein